MTADQMSVLSLAISVGMGLLSLVLSIFAIWLSLHFDKRSSAALESIKDLANEIRTLSGASLSQQQTFSVKMLDSILANGPYGLVEATEPAATEELMRAQLAQTEMRIMQSVESRVREIANHRTAEEVQDAIADIRESVGQLPSKTGTPFAVLSPLPPDLRSALLFYRDYPAYFPLLAAILREDATTPDELRAVRGKYGLQGPWQVGIESMLQKQLLEGNEQAFHLRDDLRKPLAAWFDSNAHVLRLVLAAYGQTGDEAALREKAKEIAAALMI